MPIFLCLVLWSAHARSTHLDRGWVLMAVGTGRRWWFRVCWQCLPSETKGQWDCKQYYCLFSFWHEKGRAFCLKSQELQNIDDLKKVLASRFPLLKVQWQLISRVSFSATCAVSSWFVRVSDNILNRAVCGEESRVMSSEGVPPTAPMGLILLWGDQEGESSHSPSWCFPNWYLPPTGGEPFLCCQSVASQDRTCHWNCMVFLKALCVVRTLDFAGWQLERAEQNERQASRQCIFCHRGQIL